MLLRELCDQTRGITYGIVQPGNHVVTGVPILRADNVQNGQIEVSDLLRVDPEIERSYLRSRLRGGEILVTLVGAYFGKVAVAGPQHVGMNTARAVGVIPVSSDADYIAYALRSVDCQRHFHERATTTAQPTLNLKDVADTPIPWPKPDTRRAIARILGALDDKIELNRKMNATLEAIARALFKSWFVDFDPVRAKSEGRPPTGMDAETAKLFPNDLAESPLGPIPKGWRLDSLASVLTVLETGNRPKGGVSEFTSGVPSIGAESIVRVGVFNFSKTRFVPRDFFDAMTRGKLADGDVLLYKDGGRPGEFEPHVSMFGRGFPFSEMAINEHVYRLRATDSFGQSLLYFWLASETALDEMRRKGTGVAIPGLNSNAARSLAVLVPSEAITRAFQERVDPILSLILERAKESRQLAVTRDALLPRLLSGKLSVARAEEEAGADA